MKLRTSLNLRKIILAAALAVVNSTGAFADQSPVRKGSLHCEVRAEAPEGSGQLPGYNYILDAANAEQNTLDNFIVFNSDPVLSIQKIDYATGRVETIVLKAKLNYLDSGLGHSRYTAPFSIYGLTIEFGHISGTISINHNVDGVHEYFGSGSCFVM